MVPSGDHIKEMTKKKNSKNTENNTNFALRVLVSFCKETHTSFTDINNSNLDVLLSKLYISAQTSKGENYKLNSLKSLRSGFQRYFLKERNVDIINNDVFRNSNLCYENKLKVTKANGKSNFPTFELLRIGDSKETPNYLGKNQNTKILLLKSAKSEKKERVV